MLAAGANMEAPCARASRLAASASIPRNLRQPGVAVRQAAYPTLGTEMNRRIYEISPMRQITGVVPVASSEFEEFNDLDESEAAWVGETQARPETGTPTLGKLTVPVHEVYAMPKVTQKLLDDSQLDIAEWLVEKCSQRFARKEGAAFIAGDGILKPRGLLTYPTAAEGDDIRAWGTFEHINTGTAGGFGSPPAGSDKLIDLVYSLKVAYRPGARFLMNRKTAGIIRKLKDGDGNYLWQPAAMSGEPDRLMGFPVTLAEEMPDTTTTNALAVAFGDFTAGYVIADRHGLRLVLLPTARLNPASSASWTQKVPESWNGRLSTSACVIFSSGMAEPIVLTAS